MAGTAWALATAFTVVLVAALALRVLPLGAAIDVHVVAARTVGATALLATTLAALGPAAGPMAAVAAGVVVAVRVASHAGADLRVAAWAVVGGALVSTAGPGAAWQALDARSLMVLAGCLAFTAWVEYMVAAARWTWHTVRRAPPPPRPPRPPRPQGAHGAQPRRPPQEAPPGPDGL